MKKFELAVPILIFLSIEIAIRIWPIQHTYDSLVYFPVCVSYMFLALRIHFSMKRNWLLAMSLLIMFGLLARYRLSLTYLIFPNDRLEIFSSTVSIAIAMIFIGYFLRQTKPSNFNMVMRSFVATCIVFFGPFLLRGDPILSQKVIAAPIIWPDVIEVSPSGNTIFLASNIEFCHVVRPGDRENERITLKCSFGRVLGAVCHDEKAYLAKIQKLSWWKNSVVTFDIIEFNRSTVSKKLKLPVRKYSPFRSGHLSGDGKYIALGQGLYVETIDMSLREFGLSQYEDATFLGWKADNQTAVFLDHERRTVLFERPTDKSLDKLAIDEFSLPNAQYVYRETANELVGIGIPTTGLRPLVCVIPLKENNLPIYWEVNPVYLPGVVSDPIDIGNDKILYASKIFQPLLLDLGRKQIELAVPPTSQDWGIGYSQATNEILYAKNLSKKTPYFLYRQQLP